MNPVLKLKGRIVCICSASLLWALPSKPLAQDLFYSESNGTIIITGYNGPGGDVTIPSTINGLPVTAIGDGAFAMYLEGACPTSVTIPDSVTSIGNGAFSGCTSLTNGMIPSSVTNIGNAAFAGCASLTAITVDASDPTYSSLNGVLFNKSQTTLIQYPGGKTGSYIVPSSVTGIGEGAFSSSIGLISVTMIPNSVTNIGNNAFFSCTGLTNLAIGTGVLNIGSNAFAYCSSLSAITLPGSVTSWGVFPSLHAPV